MTAPFSIGDKIKLKDNIKLGRLEKHLKKQYGFDTLTVKKVWHCNLTWNIFVEEIALLLDAAYFEKVGQVA